MKLAVTDANIFIDLIRLRWLDYFFQLPVALCTTQEVVDQLNQDQLSILMPFIENDVLKVHRFDSHTLVAIQAIPFPRGLEFADRSVIYLAQTLEAQVLTGDNLLRKICMRKGLQVNGIIWIFDALINHDIATGLEAAEKMEALLQINARLPLSECEQRISIWRKLS